MRTVKVFLCINVALEGISEKYKQVADHFDEPALLCLPWPETVIPLVGQKVFIDDMPSNLDEFVVDSHEYFVREEEIRVEVNLEPLNDLNSRCTPEICLKYAAKAGFIAFATWKPIKDLFKEAGLELED